MRAVIFTGPKTSYTSKIYHPQKNDFVIAVDQGIEVLFNTKIKVDLAIGDFDSIDSITLDQVKQRAEKMIIFDAEKDKTDTELAVDYANRLKTTEIIIFGGLSGRFDQSFANIHLLKDEKVVMKDLNTMIYLLSPGHHRISHQYKYISFFAFETVDDLSLKNFKYQLNQKTLNPFDSTCVSNEGNGDVIFKSGKLIVIHTNEH
jgi:thiamine pyrophosphokinase